MKKSLLLLAAVVLGIVIGATATIFIYDQKSHAAALAYRLDASQLYAAKRIDEAIAATYQSIALDPDLYGNYALLGDVYSAEGKKEIAISMYSAAIEKLGNGGGRSIVNLTKAQIDSERARIQNLLNALQPK